MNLYQIMLGILGRSFLLFFLPFLFYPLSSFSLCVSVSMSLFLSASEMAEETVFLNRLFRFVVHYNQFSCICSIYHLYFYIFLATPLFKYPFSLSNSLRNYNELTYLHIIVESIYQFGTSTLFLLNYFHSRLGVQDRVSHN